MRLVLTGVGGLAALGLLIVSGWMNFRFGQSLGSDAADGWFFGIASGCADGGTMRAGAGPKVKASKRGADAAKRE